MLFVFFVLQANEIKESQVTQHKACQEAAKIEASQKEVKCHKATGQGGYSQPGSHDQFVLHFPQCRAVPRVQRLWVGKSKEKEEKKEIYRQKVAHELSRPHPHTKTQERQDNGTILCIYLELHNDKLHIISRKLQLLNFETRSLWGFFYITLIQASAVCTHTIKVNGVLLMDHCNFRSHSNSPHKHLKLRRQKHCPRHC